jgi:hypothetical protein
MKRNRHLIGVIAAMTLLMGGMGITGLVKAEVVTRPSPAILQDGGESDGTGGEPGYKGSIAVDEAQFDGMSESEEAAALSSLATISSDEAKGAAEAAYPGATALKVTLSNENWSLVYSVEMSNGLDVKVDAGNATVLQADQAGGENQEQDANESGSTVDTDNVEAQNGDAANTSNVQEEQGAHEAPETTSAQ